MHPNTRSSSWRFLLSGNILLAGYLLPGRFHWNGAGTHSLGARGSAHSRPEQERGRLRTAAWELGVDAGDQHGLLRGMLAPQFMGWCFLRALQSILGRRAKAKRGLLLGPLR